VAVGLRSTAKIAQPLGFPVWAADGPKREKLLGSSRPRAVSAGSGQLLGPFTIKARH
jgi:hypothetical protein